MKVIARIYNDYQEKFGIPRQSNLVEEVISRIVFETPYDTPDAVRGLEEFSHIWLIWGFSENEDRGFRATVRPPRLGGNERKGVFATRSSFRPNGLGLSSVKLIQIEKDGKKPNLIVAGGDLMNGTPIYDIKPYLAYTDSHLDAEGGFADRVRTYTLEVQADAEAMAKIPVEKRTALKKILAQDPRPSYHEGNRVYGMKYAGYNVKFFVSGGVLTVKEVSDCRKS